jgi:hypothetical protein
MNALPIRYLTREQIDTARWDSCIALAQNTLPYAFSYFLDNMCPGWAALIVDDYRMVMPLTWKQKWGIKYLYQPPFIQQSGLFSPSAISANELEAFITAVKSHFRFAEIFLNFNNPLSAAQPRQNYVLRLGRGYDQLRSSFKTDLLKNLRSAEKTQMKCIEGNLELTLQLYQTEYNNRLPHVKKSDYDAFKRVCNSAEASNKLVIRSACDAKGGILSSVLLIRDAGRLVLSLSVTTPGGRLQSANHYLLDQVIREFCGEDMLLDFEGSEIPGIAHFYRNFGAVNQPYYFYRFNRLPWWIRFLKP